MTAYEAVVNNLDSPVPLGYSTSGEVVEVGPGVSDLKIGDKVACFGSLVANHAEYNFIPRNMCVRLPDNMDLRLAAFNMLGAIAMNGVRRAQIELGSNVLVIGLGLIGQIAVQLLNAAGCRVFGVDVDPNKLSLAKMSGAEEAMLRSEMNLEDSIRSFSNGLGVDATIITAATQSTDPVELAGRASRVRGRVIALGRIPFNLPRQEYQYKQLEFATTYAYGPGVEDANYEQKAIDYPAVYVRWSGNRNVQAFINLIADHRLKLEPLITHEFSIEDADKAFALLTGENKQPSVAILLHYASDKPYERPKIYLNGNGAKRAANNNPGVGVIGAGSHAVSFLFESMKAQNANLRGLVSAGGVKSQWYGEKYEFAYAASEPEELFNDPSIEAIFILSRHDTHGTLTAQALDAGKDVFVEKPMCLTSAELDAIVAAQEKYHRQVMVGYNRRFAPLGVQLRQTFANHAQPLAVTYRMNAGFRAPNHWMHDVEVGGGLILGEAVHFIDFIQFLVGAAPKRVFTQSVHSTTGDVIDADSVMINIQYADGSIGVVNYLSGGDKSFGRERIEVYADNTIAVLEDWRSLVVSKSGKRHKYGSAIKQDKGFNPEVETFLTAIKKGESLPVPFNEVVTGMRTALAAVESLRTGMPIEIR